MDLSWTALEDRKDIFRTLYPVVAGDIAERIFRPATDRKQLRERCHYAREFGIDCSVMRLLLDYNRYSEIQSIAGNYQKVLDYGCGAGDYGVAFAKNGSQVTFYDLPDMIACARERCRRLALGATYALVPDEPLDETYDLVVFSEVLEHLENPLGTLQKTKAGAMFLTAYPYVPDDSPYFQKGGHTRQAHEQAASCRKYLETHYRRKSVGKWYLLTVI